MKRWIMSAALWLALVPASSAAPSASNAETVVKQRIAAQTAAWNRGDIEGALDVYCPSEEIVWATRSGISRGYAAFAEDMRSSYGGDAHGLLTNDVIYLARFGDAVVVTLRWSVIRDGARVLGGVSTQLWTTCAGAMRVVYEHAS